MNETPSNRKGWRRLRRVLIGLAIFATLTAIFYTEEDWRGKRAWEQCKAELETKGAVLDWDKFIPPAVPDDQNFFKAPKMTEWFVGRGETELSKRLSTNEVITRSIGSKTNLITGPAQATDYLAWSDRFKPDFDLIRNALQRPYARMDGDYVHPAEVHIPNFVQVRDLAQVLAQRTHCYLLLGQPEKALQEVTLLNDSRKLLEGAPTGKPMTLVAAMINVAVVAVYVNTIAEGLEENRWQEPQLIVLQKQLQAIDLPPFVAEAFRGEQTSMSRIAETTSFGKLMYLDFGPLAKPGLWQKIKNSVSIYALMPRGWVYQNMVVHARNIQKVVDDFDPGDQVIPPEKISGTMREFETIFQHRTPFNLLATVAIPNFTKAIETLAANQTLANQAQIACALHRYHLAHGEYPESLDALVPQFITKLPHDVIDGRPLHYHRTKDGKFLLYSIGWNQTDDGGTAAFKKDGSDDRDNGDWVWKN